MKKIIIVLIGLLALLPISAKAINLTSNYTSLEETVELLGFTKNKKYDIKSDDVEIILFYGSGCPHCHDFVKFLNAFDKEYNHINLKAFEVWEDQANSKLMQDVGKEMDVEIRGVPFIIIGKKYYVGYGTSMENEIRDVIKTEYETPVNQRESYFSTKATTSNKKTKTTTTKKTTTVTTTTSNVYKEIEEEPTTTKSTSNNKKENKDEEKEESFLSKYKFFFIGAWVIVIGVFAYIIIRDVRNRS